jgi:hypothetical protein
MSTVLSAGSLWALSVAVAGAAAGWAGYTLGGDACQARQARENRAVQQALDKSAAATAQALSAIEVRHVQITQPVQREVRERVVYRECRHTPDGLRAVNAALAEPEPSGRRKLPPAGAAD